MALKERVIDYDYMRGGRNPLTIRFDGDILVKLPCHCAYDPKLCGKKGNHVMLVRSAEVKNTDGTWRPYPTATWLDDVEYADQLVSKALVKRTGGDGGFDFMVSTNGVPDGKLLVAAREAGVYTETIDG